jgi:hypothetical protein
MLCVWYVYGMCMVYVWYVWYVWYICMIVWYVWLYICMVVYMYGMWLLLHTVSVSMCLCVCYNIYVSMCLCICIYIYNYCLCVSVSIYLLCLQRVWMCWTTMKTTSGPCCGSVLVIWAYALVSVYARCKSTPHMSYAHTITAPDVAEMDALYNEYRSMLG